MRPVTLDQVSQQLLQGNICNGLQPSAFLKTPGPGWLATESEDHKERI